MNLDEIQPFIANALRAAPALAGVPILEDDGSFPKTPDRERHLREKGLVVIVGQIESEGLTETNLAGVVPHGIYVPVVIDENVKVNRSNSGTKITGAAVLQEVFSSITGQPKASKNNRRFMPYDPPFYNVGAANGASRIVASFVYQAIIQPV